ncbi:MAG: hypothetical protein WB643_14500 [Candidatus Bathyarchaeia archaeon]
MKDEGSGKSQQQENIGGTGEMQVTYKEITGSVRMPLGTTTLTNIVEDMVSREMKKRVEIPVALTTCVLSAVLAVFAVIFGIVILSVPFTIAFLYAAHSAYTLRSSLKEEQIPVSYEELGDTTKQIPEGMDTTQALSLDSNDTELREAKDA